MTVENLRITSVLLLVWMTSTRATTFRPYSPRHILEHNILIFRNALIFQNYDGRSNYMHEHRLTIAVYKNKVQTFSSDVCTLWRGRKRGKCENVLARC